MVQEKQNSNVSANKRIAKNTAFLYIRMAFILIVSIYTSRIVLNTLGITDYGVYNVVAGFVSMFGFLNTSLSSCTQRFYNYEKGHIGYDGFRNVYITSIIIQFCLVSIILLLVETFGVWYLENKLVIPEERMNSARILFQLSIIQMVLVIMQVPYTGAVMAKERMDYYAIIGMIDIVLKLIVVIILPFLSFDKLVIYGILSTLIILLDFFLYYIYSKKHFPNLKFKFEIHKDLFKSMLSFSGWTVFSSFTFMMRNQGLNLVLNAFFGPVVNAARGVAYQIQSAIMGFIQNIPTAARPQIVESYAKQEYERSKQLMFSISKASFIMLFAIVLPVIGEINFILHVWLGDTIPEYTTIFTILILVITLVDVLNTPISIFIMATGKVALYSAATSIIGIIVIPLSYILLHFGGSPESVFYAAIFVSVLVQTSSIVILNKETNITFNSYIRMVIFPITLVVVCSSPWPFLIKFLLPESAIRLFINLICSVTSVFLTTYIVGINMEERSLIKKFGKSFMIKIKKL
jgi:O-antigen/teichoic acid export membrane protein